MNDEASSDPDIESTTSTASTRWRRALRRWLISALIAILILAAVYGSLEYVTPSNITLAGVCGQLSLTRRGLPCDIPLPSDATFMGSASAPYGQGIPMTSWTYHTSQSLPQIGALYTQEGGAWWVCAKGSPEDTWLRITGGADPNRPDTTLDVIAIRNGAGRYKLTVGLIKSGTPFWSACNGV